MQALELVLFVRLFVCVSHSPVHNDLMPAPELSIDTGVFQQQQQQQQQLARAIMSKVRLLQIGSNAITFMRFMSRRNLP